MGWIRWFSPTPSPVLTKASLVGLTNLVERILNLNYISKDFRAFLFVLVPKTLNTCCIQFCNLAFAVCTQTYDIVLKYYDIVLKY